MSRAVVSCGLVLALLAPSSVAGSIVLPDGPIARAVSALGPDVTPAELPKLPTTGSWSRWAALLDAESRASAPDPARRAELALLALDQERWDDAWRHLEAASQSPTWLAALLPRFLPGASSGRLPDGVTLRPSLPPSTPGAPRGRVDRRVMKIDELAVGEAIVDVSVAVEVEGVQIDITHRSGGAARLSVRIPEPAEFAIAQEYVDWYRQDQTRIAHALEVRPGDPTHTIYGRFEPHGVRFTAELPETLNAQLSSGTLWILAGGEPSERALAGEIAESLAKGPLRIAARVLAPGESPPPAEWTGVRVDLSEARERSRKLAWLASSVEAFALHAKHARPR
jgi:hypothetical protein